MTRDHFFHGMIVLRQPTTGYRFSIDAVLLSHLVHPAPGETVVDLGTGCGVIPIMLAFRHADIRIFGVEIQASLAKLARENVTDNHMSHRIRILQMDMKALSPANVDGPVDLVVTNPPYRKRDSGRINVDGEKAVARHELKIDLQGVVVAAHRLLRKSGRFCIIYPSVRAVDLVAAMRTRGVEPKTLTMIHSKSGSPARFVSITGVKDGRPGLEVTPPLTIYREDGTYTRIVEAMISG